MPFGILAAVSFALVGSGSAAAGVLVGGPLPVEVIDRPSAMFSRKPLSEEEIAAVVSGGAEMWD